MDDVKQALTDTVNSLIKNDTETAKKYLHDVLVHKMSEKLKIPTLENKIPRRRLNREK